MDDRYCHFTQIVGSPLAMAVNNSPTGPFTVTSTIRAPEGYRNVFGGRSVYFVSDQPGQAVVPPKPQGPIALRARRAPRTSTTLIKSHV